MHPKTRLSPYSRERMLQEHQGGVPVTVLARRYGISRTTFYRWRRRGRSQGKGGLGNRPSRPYRIHYRLSPSQIEEVVQLRCLRHLGLARLAPLLGAPASTIYRCLRRRGMGRLPRPPRPPVVRYETSAPGKLVHLDVLHLFALKGQKPAYQFTLVDGYARLAYALIAPRRTTEAALEAVRQAQTYFSFPIQRVLTDNDVTFAWTPRRRWRGGPPGGVSRFTRTLHQWGIRHSVTQVRRPQTNGKVERFHRTIQEELYRPHPLFVDEGERQAALQRYLAYYNQERHHTALGGLTPVQRRDGYFWPMECQQPLETLQVSPRSKIPPWVGGLARLASIIQHPQTLRYVPTEPCC